MSGAQQQTMFRKEDFAAEVKPPPGEPKGWWTLDQVRVYCRLRAERGLQCPCCQQRVKVYRRKLNRTMAYVLLRLYNRFRTPDEWFHLPTFVKQSDLSPSVYGDVTKLVHWELLEPKQGDPQADGNPHAGYYRLTRLAIDFCLNKIAVPKFIRLYDNRKLSSAEKATIRITEALTSKFNYSELMRS